MIKNTKSVNNYCRGAVTHRHVCFKCRKCTHKHSLNTTCPNCHGECVDVGCHFRAPKRNNIKAWRVLELAITSCNIRFYTHGSGYIPRLKREVDQLIAHNQSFHLDKLSDFLNLRYGACYGKGQRVSYRAAELFAK